MKKQTYFYNLLFITILLSSICFGSNFANDKPLNATINITAKDTSDESVILNYYNGEIQAYLTRYYPALDRYARVLGTFIEDKGNIKKFGAIDRLLAEGNIAQYKYFIFSKNPTYEKDGNYYFYDGNLSNIDGFIHINFNDICNKANAECKFNRYKVERILLPDTYFITVEFNSTKYIDPQFAGGLGTAISPYQITNWSALNDIRTCLNCYYVLNNDLDKNTIDYAGIGDNWFPVGNVTVGYEFTGKIDGQGHNISDLKVLSNGTRNRGLFEYTSTGADISNINFHNATVISGNRGGIITANGIIGAHFMYIDGVVYGTGGGANADIGGLVGYCGGSSTGGINNIIMNINITHTTGSNTGGMIGRQGGSSCNVSNSIVNGNITGNGYIGGFFGTQSSNLDNLTFTGVLKDGTGGLVGGIVGSSGGGINKNMRVNANITSNGNSVGGIAGTKTTGTIVNSSAYVNIITSTGSSSNVGGIIGYATSGLVNTSYFEGNVLGRSMVGGIIGQMQNIGSRITSCYSNGTINASFDFVGGLVGRCYKGRIISSYSLSTIKRGDTDYIGGLVGRLDDCNMTWSYAQGKIDLVGKSYTGGLIGFLGNTTRVYINESFWDKDTVGYATSAGGYGTAYSTAQMKLNSSFGNWSIQESENDLNNGYPFLAWQDNNSSYTWLIKKYVAPSNCWSKTGNVLFIPTGCVFELLKGVLFTLP